MISDLSKNCEIVTCDLTDLKTIESIKNKAHEMVNPLVLINNAGMRIHEIFEKIT